MLFRSPSCRAGEGALVVAAPGVVIYAFQRCTAQLRCQVIARRMVEARIPKFRVPVPLRKGRGSGINNRMQPLPHTRSCFVCGEANPLGLRLRMETDGRKVFTRWTPAAEHIGFQDTVHGGLISTVLDEVMVWACAIPTRRFAYCAELTVRFRQPIRPGMETRIESELTRNLRDRIYEAWATVRDAEGHELAVATGKYRPIPNQATEALLADVVGDMARWIDIRKE